MSDNSECLLATTNSEFSTPYVATAVVSSTISLPEFLEQNPAAWYIQVEARLELLRATSETIKYFLVVDRLPVAVMDEITQLLQSFAHELPSSRCEVINAATMARTATPELSWIQQRLNLMGTRASTTNSTLVCELFFRICLRESKW